MLTRIYLDIDGVCNSIFAAWLRANGCRIDSDDDWPRPGSRAVVETANVIRARQGMPALTKDEFWANCGYYVWADAPRSQEFWALLIESARQVGVSNVFFCTKPTKASSCAASDSYMALTKACRFGNPHSRQLDPRI